ncbi:2-keto-4-pentenoate hydratase/2-oxohepta-3-ene-1,7-dioic acid hydratase in catechol pathway [Desulfobaculum xiamenense]|uniref:2-keto-4-pentenoate hydratase/2-oxohepta-3-ene-1,7-dioic acid hydratase in catechol pathway n=1 Tax=Desulfobaculum xiamenense TaxID=995050 RepID=A0A846QQB0_9BACT|nr:fumarylacetoacetate hydrolase family protein [Desulfobaculum xiamenense]NJB67585.1 2-keto-4-pentenoate hydratase/2-oxohepta-3-ene-1,7-dioic acid hydratase in catechol pathway [Desulfobaculum xiamenense]
MRIIRIEHYGTSFYARVTEEGLMSLDRTRGTGGIIPPEQARLLQLAVPSKIVRIDCSPGGSRTPDISLKPPSCIISTSQSVLLPAGTTDASSSACLAVLMGHQCRETTPADVRKLIFGFTCANDISATVPGLSAPGSTAAGGFDTFAPIGPFLETDIDMPEELVVTTSVNGEPRCDMRLDELALSPFEAISRISRIMTLQPGDVVLIGSTGMETAIANGDLIEVNIAGIGTLENSIKALATDTHAGHDTSSAPVQ